MIKINWFSWFEDRFEDRYGICPADPDYSQSPFPERSGDGGDRVL
jgi:hypothetical protein